MAEVQKSSQGDGTYFIEAENAAEMARLINQDRIITRSMGGFFPPNIDLSNIHDILDIACGPGGWALDVARAYPDKRVTAIDISQIMVAFARYQAAQMEIPNVHFQVMTILQPLAFVDQIFDLVNVRFISGFLPQTQWPPFLQECFRITRPGGLIRLIEPERTISNSPSVEQINDFLARAMHRAGQSSSPNELQFGVTPLLRNFLSHAGYLNVQKAAYVLESSAGTEEHLSQYQNSMAFYKLLQPFFVKTGIATQEEAEVLYQRALDEMMKHDYCAVWYFLSAWGEKPR
jgi:ubiquinone/menaquinone biosynthesis C-methylase UbiE